MGDVVVLYGPEEEMTPLELLHEDIMDLILNNESQVTVPEVVGVLETIKYELFRLSDATNESDS